MQIKIDQGQLMKVQALLAGTKGNVGAVFSRAINKTLTSTSSQAAKEVTAVYNIAQKNVKTNFTSLKATAARPSGQFRSKGGPKSLTSFTGTRAVVKGVSVKVLKTGSRKTLLHSFIATAKGSQQVFWREKIFKRPLIKGFPYGRLPKKPYRYPVIVRKGPRIEDALGKPEVNKRLMTYANDRLAVVAEQELTYELSKL